MNQFTADSISYLAWELGVEFEIALTDVSYFNVKKKIYAKINLTVNIEY